MVFLLVTAPDEDARASETTAAVIVGRQRQALLVQLLLDYDGVVYGQSATAVFGRGGRPQPALFTEAAAQVSQLEISVVGQVVGVGGELQSIRQGFGEPFPDLTAKFLLFCRVSRLEIHKSDAPSHIHLNAFRL